MTQIDQLIFKMHSVSWARELSDSIFVEMARFLQRFVLEDKIIWCICMHVFLENKFVEGLIWEGKSLVWDESFANQLNLSLSKFICIGHKLTVYLKRSSAIVYFKRKQTEAIITLRMIRFWCLAFSKKKTGADGSLGSGRCTWYPWAEFR